MPRVLLGSLSPDHVRNREYSAATRLTMYDTHRGGLTIGQIADKENIPDFSIRTMLIGTTIQHNCVSFYRKGRPFVLNDYQCSRILRYVRANPKHTYAQVIEHYDLTTETRSTTSSKKTAYTTGLQRNDLIERRPMQICVYNSIRNTLLGLSSNENRSYKVMSAR